MATLFCLNIIRMTALVTLVELSFVLVHILIGTFYNIVDLLGTPGPLMPYRH